METPNRLPAYKPKAMAPCLCGSALKYAECCKSKLPGTSLGRKTRDLWNKQNLSGALQSCRADITQYTIWHKSHTEPLLLASVSEIQPIMEIDLKAMTELVSDLCVLLYRTGRKKNILPTLERLRQNILDLQWAYQITYFQSFTNLAVFNDAQAAKRILEQLGDIENFHDNAQIQQLYFELYGRELSFTDRDRLLTRLINVAEDDGQRIQYTTAKGVEFYLIGDDKAALEFFETALNLFRNITEKNEVTSFAKIKAAGTLQLIGIIKSESEYFLESNTILKNLINEDRWTDSGLADLHRQIGDNYKHLQNWKEAQRSFDQAYVLDSALICKIMSALASAEGGDTNAAWTIIMEVDESELDSYETEDFVFYLSRIAELSKDNNKIRYAVDKLNSLRCSNQFFENRRTTLVAALTQRIMTKGSMKAIPTEDLSLSIITRYVQLQPNIFGVGINFNNILSDIISTVKNNRSNPYD